jgi:hypothetical protein
MRSDGSDGSKRPHGYVRLLWATLTCLSVVGLAACDESEDTDTESRESDDSSRRNKARRKKARRNKKRRKEARRKSDGKKTSDGVGSVDDVPSLLEKAQKLGASTWPGGKLVGVKVGDEAKQLSRTGKRVRVKNVYTLRVQYRFDADPTDPTAKSGSVVCNPACRVIRHQVRPSVSPPPFPCPFDAALSAARKAGLTSKRPVIGYGSWAFDASSGETWTGWSFRENATAPVVEIGAGCKVVPP